MKFPEVKKQAVVLIGSRLEQKKSIEISMLFSILYPRTIQILNSHWQLL